MTLQIAATLVVSGAATVFMWFGTNNRILTVLAFAFLPLMSLAFWVVKALTGTDPGAFIPNWMAGAMIIGACMLFFAGHIDENSSLSDKH